jgi:hypothetical protein
MLLKWLWFPRALMQWALCVLALILVAMIANPLVRPSELRSISATAGVVDRNTMPPLQRFSARDGTLLAYRHRSSPKTSPSAEWQGHD